MFGAEIRKENDFRVTLNYIKVKCSSPCPRTNF